MWLPDGVTRELAEERTAYEAELAEQAVRLHDQLEHYNRALKQIDPYLELVLASDNATALGLRPGFFHVVRHNPGAPPELWPLETEDGGFREPDSSLFEDLARSDMWSNRSMKARQKAELDAQRAKERAREREQEDRATEVLERWTAASRPQVLIR